MRSGSSSSSSRFKIRPKQANASTCDFDRCWRQHRDTLTRFEERYMSTKVTAARIYEYGEPDVFRFETMDVPGPVGLPARSSREWYLSMTSPAPIPAHRSEASNLQGMGANLDLPAHWNLPTQ